VSGVRPRIRGGLIRYAVKVPHGVYASHALARALKPPEEDVLAVREGGLDFPRPRYSLTECGGDLSRFYVLNEVFKHNVVCFAKAREHGKRCTSAHRRGNRL